MDDSVTSDGVHITLDAFRRSTLSVALPVRAARVVLSRTEIDLDDLAIGSIGVEVGHVRLTFATFALAAALFDAQDVWLGLSEAEAVVDECS